MPRRKTSPRQHACSFDEAMRLMHKHDSQLQEDGFGMLRLHARENVSRLVDAFHQEPKHGLKCWLLELIGEAKSPEALPTLLECLHSDDDSLRFWAAHGLRKLNSKEARRALWEAGDSE